MYGNGIVTQSIRQLLNYSVNDALLGAGDHIKVPEHLLEKPSNHLL